ncbi:sugar phosphate isomerase/epimerase family protein [Tenggerimyces flavus]|uniref:Sugar phosphate isomerase/epimerase family protein n=1 Tax=Tenggerimyces flavus TaxID=1708749 RepID=A0ABV7YK29_9ACTN|nr:sugar phosphate isomerase/epimerase [Tenggerimyces flavus]MBM7789655.1 sugar phosphate isomerase/epimerase [Tenggerimyces flavus]
MIGLQLYTLRHALASESELAETLRRVREIGYSGVEPYVELAERFGLSRFASVVRDAGLRLLTHHLDFTRLEADVAGAAKDCHAMGGRWIVLANVPAEFRSVSGAVTFARRASEVARQLAVEGLGLAFHNHRYEFERDESGLRMFDVLWENASEDLQALIDIGWVHAAGDDPVAWLGTLSGRVPLVHAKDVRGSGTSVQTVAVGEGEVSWPAVVTACEKAGVQWYVVEQDHCADDPFASIARSFTTLRPLLADAP